MNRWCRSVGPATNVPRTVWNFYEIKHNAIVVSLTEQPVVLRGIGQSQDGGWLDASMATYLR